MIQHLKGRWGEDRAVEYLKKKGYEIVARNYTKKWGEVDIIILKDHKVTFCEVKCWDYITWDDLHYKIGKDKIRRMGRLAEAFLQENPQYRDCPMGFDLILLSRRMRELEHIEDFIP